MHSHAGAWERDYAVERQMAHMERNKIRAAYIHHARYLDERREMMQWWADFLDGSKAQGKLLPIKWRKEEAS